MRYQMLEDANPFFKRDPTNGAETELRKIRNLQMREDLYLAITGRGTYAPSYFIPLAGKN